jgi:hypothetical protein
MRGISVLAILVGAASDLVLTIVLSVLLEVWVYTTTDMSHLPHEQAQAALAAAASGPTVLHFAQLGLGLACSVLGGFIAAALSAQRQLLNSVIAGLLVTVLNLVLLARGVVSSTPFVELGLTALSFACYPFGAVLRMRFFPARARPV